jgi:hypothetical protein
MSKAYEEEIYRGIRIIGQSTTVIPGVRTKTLTSWTASIKGEHLLADTLEEIRARIDEYLAAQDKTN